MIAHIAHADEQRGRVVLWLGGSGEAHDTAVDAALRLAQAFESEIESLFIEDCQLYDLAELPFAREISLSGRRTRAFSAASLAKDMQAHAAALQRSVLARARAADVKVQTRVVRAEPIQALAQACAENGPWNVVTVGTPIGQGNMGVAEIFDTVHATTGIVVTGPKAQRTSGPVIAVVEELERLVPMMRAAERIATATGGDARLWLLEHDQARQDWIEGQIRLALSPSPNIKFDVVDMSIHTPLDVARLMRRQRAGFVIARFGGVLAPHEDGVAPFAEALDGPLFLVR
ncbi:hypothetical protein [Hyphomicrobium sp.]|uniref:hypothetical protein n=1 Tax=Hyphomicrobium sp. TaxID=82 RepID=UPI002E307631|nr:hypothetical protein [Hyphomicrobium sp.]HEX2840930.1 hypothetical protein [Hyphomicrobium sp.]